jgi:hypothetical protein
MQLTCFVLSLLTDNGFVGIYESYTLDHCRMVKYVGDVLPHAQAALAKAIQGKLNEKLYDKSSFLLTLYRLQFGDALYEYKVGTLLSHRRPNTHLFD